MISVCHLPDHGLTVVKLEGSVPLDEVLRYVQFRAKQTSMPRMGTVDSLIDLRQLSNTLSYEEVSRVADELQRIGREWGDKRAALLVSRDAHYGVSRMFSMVLTARASANISTFRRIEDAAAWLERPLAAILAEIPPDAWLSPP